jgi:teichuronic acid biosynthesis glycosyltransferase TuaH
MSPTETLVYLSGERWDAVAGTNRRLATALGAMLPVLWVDPPASALTRDATGGGMESVADGVTRLRPRTIPGWTRRGGISITERLMSAQVGTALRRIGGRSIASVLTSPLLGFPASSPAPRLLYVTDDWLAGAELMGMPADRLRSSVAAHAGAADLIAAITDEVAVGLARLLTEPPEITVLPNGCPTVPEPRRHVRRDASIALIGQLNERLDLDLLDSVAATGLPIVVAGPRADRAADASARLDRFLTQPSVDYRGVLDPGELPALLETVTVGITPYADTDFNRASFPLKTLEYLASGIRVVATDLPAVRRLGTPLIRSATTPSEFAAAVVQACSTPLTHSEIVQRRDYADRHSWPNRARALLELLDGGTPHGGHRATIGAHRAG